MFSFGTTAATDDDDNDGDGVENNMGLVDRFYS